MRWLNLRRFLCKKHRLAGHVPPRPTYVSAPQGSGGSSEQFREVLFARRTRSTPLAFLPLTPSTSITSWPAVRAPDPPSTSPCS